jgi:hypothetical protein
MAAACRARPRAARRTGASRPGPDRRCCAAPSSGFRSSPGGIVGAVLGLLAGVTAAEAPPWAAGPGTRIRPGTMPPSIAAAFPAAVIGGDRFLPPGAPVACPSAALPAAPGRPAHRDPRCADRPGTGGGRMEGWRR